MYTVTIKSLARENETKARWMELDLEHWLNKYQNEDRIVYILRSLLKENDSYLPTNQ